MAAYLARLAGLPLSPLPAPRSSGASRRTCCPFSSSVVSVSFLRGGTCTVAGRARAHAFRRFGLRSAAENAQNAAERNESPRCDRRRRPRYARRTRSVRVSFAPTRHRRLRSHYTDRPSVRRSNDRQNDSRNMKRRSRRSPGCIVVKNTRSIATERFFLSARNLRERSRDRYASGAREMRRCRSARFPRYERTPAGKVWEFAVRKVSDFGRSGASAKVIQCASLKKKGIAKAPNRVCVKIKCSEWMVVDHTACRDR